MEHKVGYFRVATRGFILKFTFDCEDSLLKIKRRAWRTLSARLKIEEREVPDWGLQREIVPEWYIVLLLAIRMTYDEILKRS